MFYYLRLEFFCVAAVTRVEYPVHSVELDGYFLIDQDIYNYKLLSLYQQAHLTIVLVMCFLWYIGLPIFKKRDPVACAMLLRLDGIYLIFVIYMNKLILHKKHSIYEIVT